MNKAPVPSLAFMNEMKRKISIEEAKKQVARQKFEKDSLQAKKVSVAGMVNNGWVDVYTNQVPYELDVLRTNLYSKVDIGWLIQTILGTGVDNPLWAVNFPCAPISPPGLSVTVGPGIIYDFGFLLPSAYSVIPQDVNIDHQIYKSYISFDTQTFATPAPMVPGHSVIHLIQAAQETVSVNSVSRPYFNSADPATPIFETQPDTMQDLTLVAIKLGVEGVSPVAPTPDAGYTPLYYISVTYGQTSIISGNITIASGAPFITESLTQKASSSSALTAAQLQTSSPIIANDIGTVNVLVANPSPIYPAYIEGTHIFIKVANTNTGPATANINSIGDVPINIMLDAGLTALFGGEMIDTGIYEFIYNSTIPCFQLLNPTLSTSTANVASISMLGTQSIGNSPAKILFDTNDTNFNANAWWDPVNYRFIPQLPGFFNFNCILNLGPATLGNVSTAKLFIYKNGALWRQLDLQYNGTISDGSGTTNSPPFLNGSTKSFANGSTDFFEIYASSTLTVNVGGNFLQNEFSIEYLGNQ